MPGPAPGALLARASCCLAPTPACPTCCLHPPQPPTSPFHPSQPKQDVGTNNKALLEDPQYQGLRQRRVTGRDYDALVEEFIQALKEWQPHVLLQFEVRAGW